MTTAYLCECGRYDATPGRCICGRPLPNVTGARDEGLTDRQREALEWLGRVGKATRTTLRRHGFSERTMGVLVDRGLASRSSLPGYPFAPVWRSVLDGPSAQEVAARNEQDGAR